jgi:hypothetical protein
MNDDDEVSKALLALIKQFGNDPKYKQVILELLGILSEDEEDKLKN